MKDKFLKLLKRASIPLIALLLVIVMLSFPANTSIAKYVNLYSVGNFFLNLVQHRYTVVLDAGEGNINGAETKTITVDYNGSYGDLPVPIRDGYIFGSWVDAKGNKITEKSNVELEESQTFTAEWVKELEIGDYMTLDLSTGLYNWVTTTEKTETSLKGYTNEHTSKPGRYDPQLIFDLGEGYSSAGIDYIKIVISNERLQDGDRVDIFFDTLTYYTDASGIVTTTPKAYDSTRMLKGYYDSDRKEDDYYTVLIDTSQLATWTGTITKLRIDPFDNIPDDAIDDDPYTPSVSTGADTGGAFHVKEISFLTKADSFTDITTYFPTTNPITYNMNSYVTLATGKEDRYEAMCPSNYLHNVEGLNVNTNNIVGVMVCGNAKGIPAGTMFQLVYTDENNPDKRSENMSFGEVYGVSGESSTTAKDFVMYFDTSHGNPGLRANFDSTSKGDGECYWANKTLATLRVDPFDPLHTEGLLGTTYYTINTNGETIYGIRTDIEVVVTNVILIYG